MTCALVLNPKLEPEPSSLQIVLLPKVARGLTSVGHWLALFLLLSAFVCHLLLIQITSIAAFQINR